MNQLPPENRVEDSGTTRQTLRVGRLMAVVIPLAVAISAAALAWGYFDLEARIAEWMRPSLYPVTGQVFFNDTPLAGAHIMTQPANSKYMGAMAISDDEGHFSLQTDVHGTFETGAFAGEHLVSISKGDTSRIMGPAPQALLTPGEYANFATTPFRIQVDSGSAGEPVVFRLSGSPPEQTSQAEPPMRPGPPPAGGGPGKFGKKKGPAGPPPSEDGSDAPKLVAPDLEEEHENGQNPDHEP